MCYEIELFLGYWNSWWTLWRQSFKSWRYLRFVNCDYWTNVEWEFLQSQTTVRIKYSRNEAHANTASILRDYVKVSVEYDFWLNELWVVNFELKEKRKLEQEVRHLEVNKSLEDTTNDQIISFLQRKQEVFLFFFCFDLILFCFDLILFNLWLSPIQGFPFVLMFGVLPISDFVWAVCRVARKSRNRSTCKARRSRRASKGKRCCPRRIVSLERAIWIWFSGKGSTRGMWICGWCCEMWILKCEMWIVNCG